MSEKVVKVVSKHITESIIKKSAKSKKKEKPRDHVLEFSYRPFEIALRPLIKEENTQR